MARRSAGRDARGRFKKTKGKNTAAAAAGRKGARRKRKG